MSGYEVKTPIVLESVEAARIAISGIRDGSLEPSHANVLVRGARALQGAVAVDIRARMAGPKIDALEQRVAQADRARPRPAGRK